MPAGAAPIPGWPEVANAARQVAAPAAGNAALQSKQGGLRVNVNRSNKKPTDPNPAGYFHALSSQSGTVYGAIRHVIRSEQETAAYLGYAGAH
jgi:hypothetical protein